jgi:hypothetical protein
LPVSVGSPTAAANSATQNSATNGAPGPATGTGVSPNRTASPIDSAGCRSAHAQAWTAAGLGGVAAAGGPGACASTPARCPLRVEAGCRVMAPF